MGNYLVAWLRRQIEQDLSYWRDFAAAYLANVEREGEVLYFEARERVEDCEARQAILGLYEKQSAKAGENAMEEDRAWTLWPVVCLLSSAYRHRHGYRQEWEERGGRDSDLTGQDTLREAARGLFAPALIRVDPDGTHPEVPGRDES